jgi:SNF2 family DNA or RNA helicase
MKMTLDPYWDKPQYSSESLEKLKATLQDKSQSIQLTKAEMELAWSEEQALRLQLQKIRDKRDALVKAKSDLEYDYQKLRTVEIDFLEELKRQEELARINGELSELEKQINDLCNDLKFWQAILPFQKEDVMYAVNAWKMGLTGVLNANDMGLGKTFESLAMYYIINKLFEEKHGRKMRTIWVTKKSLIKSTVRELKAWHEELNIMPLANIPDKATRNFFIKLAYDSGSILVVNYEALSTTPELIEDYTWDMVFMDEVHKLKGGANYTPTKVWTAARDLVHKSRAAGGFYIPLSGSPISNHPKEMWAYLHLFDPVRFPTVGKFERMYCSWYGQGFAVQPDLLIKAMKSQVIRRRKDEVSIQLPELTYDYRNPEHTEAQAKVYAQMRDEFFIWLDDQGEDAPLTATVIIAQLNRLRQINLWPDALTHKPTGSGKIDETMDLIMELCETDEQVVVFSSQFNDPLYEVKSRVTNLGWSCAIIEGASKDVDDICEDFRQGKINVLCVNMKSGGEGLNLQKSDRWPGGAAHAIFLDLWWNPSVNEQAEARIYRKGANVPVTMHIMQCEGTVDMFIQAKLDMKTEMITGVMESASLRKGDWKKQLEDLI